METSKYLAILSSVSLLGIEPRFPHVIKEFFDNPKSVKSLFFVIPFFLIKYNVRSRNIFSTSFVKIAHKIILEFVKTNNIQLMLNIVIDFHLLLNYNIPVTRYWTN